jgi:hypothetical protein
VAVAKRRGLRGPPERGGRKIRLTDDRESLRQGGVERVGIEVDDGELLLQPLPGGRGEDPFPPLRRRVEENERSA